MTNEIKEILDNPKILMLSYGHYVSLTDYVKLTHYITNLQEENERLKVNCNLGYEELKTARKYKSRCEKAIEYGNNCLENLKDQEDYLCESIDIVGLLKMIHKNYIKILQGEDNE